MNLKSVPKGVLGAVAALLLVCMFFGYGILSAGSDRDSVISQLAKLQKKARDERHVASATTDSGLNPDVARAQVMNQFTNHIAAATVDAGVKLSQLQFDPTVTKIMTSPEASGAKKGGWALNNVSFAIDGPTPQVYLAIRKIAEMTEPFGLSEVSINRVVNAGTGAQGVSASIRVVLLVPSEGS